MPHLESMNTNGERCALVIQQIRATKHAHPGENCLEVVQDLVRQDIHQHFDWLGGDIKQVNYTDEEND